MFPKSTPDLDFTNEIEKKNYLQQPLVSTLNLFALAKSIEYTQSADMEVEGRGKEQEEKRVSNANVQER